ncbi:tyrosine kinase receptor Cad96Ca-like isoform X2 [Acropora muricata]|uniref:tyrosine kinase receptor Cad96Ca-like isoform X2 n=1 Tax=Acropora muricata TaxID=159855 RepID=UPI0034E541C6
MSVSTLSSSSSAPETHIRGSVDPKTSFALQIINHKTEKEEKQLKVYLVALGVSAVVLCLGIAITFVWFKRRARAQRTAEASEKTVDNYKTTENVYFSPNVSCWEIPFNSITFRDILGSGAFGEVWKAVAHGIKGISGETEVAVKKLKHNSSDTERESLIQEIDLCRSLDGERNPNIVNFLGYVSRPMMLILEYVPHGDLLGCLRKSRGMDDQYYSCPENFQEEITSYDLLSFAQQIAYGMSFLASKKILHRDLAARNILVGRGKICKIADFGLALIRDKYQYLYCTYLRKGRLPIKWTAPEHLFNDSMENDTRVSEKSDVWSYGVVLHEIFTLGGMPYPGWNEWKVVFELKVNKYRMPQPEHVSDDLYQLMLDCWNENPINRPTFDRLYEITTGILQDEHYLDLDLSKYDSSRYMNVEEIVDSTNFQKPTPENGDITDEKDALKDANAAIEEVITRL